jgi:acetyl esterase
MPLDPMPLDPDCLKVHALYALAKRPPLELQTPTEARDGMTRSRPILQPDPPEVAEVRNLTAQGPHGAIQMRLYRPLAPAAPLGVLIYFHGGGWVIGDLESHDALCRELANQSGHSVVAVDYRLAPEHRFPAAVDDAIAATQHIVAHATTLGIDPARIAVGGDSAGGNLAAVVAIALRGELAHPLSFQLLIYPAVDSNMSRPSINSNGDVLPLTRNAMAWFWEHYSGGVDLRQNWRASPISAADHSGLPPAYVATAGYDVLLDEGRAYADQLAAAGVVVTRQHYPGMIHGFITMGRLVAVANTATKDAALALKTALA